MKHITFYAQHRHKYSGYKLLYSIIDEIIKLLILVQYTGDIVSILQDVSCSFYGSLVSHSYFQPKEYYFLKSLHYHQSIKNFAACEVQAFQLSVRYLMKQHGQPNQC